MRFIATTKKRITDSEMGTTSVVVAYYLLLSLFPLIIAFGKYFAISKNRSRDSIDLCAANHP